MKKPKEDKVYDSTDTINESESETAVNDLENEESKNTEEAKTEEPIEIKIDYKSKFLYLAAEMDNLRKRFEKQREDTIKYGNERILSELLEVIDTFDHTIRVIDPKEDPKLVSIVEGLLMVQKRFLEILKNNGLEEVNALGLDFDPKVHEAISYQDGGEENKILEVMQKGYLLNGRLLRPAKVILAKGA